MALAQCLDWQLQKLRVEVSQNLKDELLPIYQAGSAYPGLLRLSFTKKQTK